MFISQKNLEKLIDERIKEQLNSLKDIVNSDREYIRECRNNIWDIEDYLEISKEYVKRKK